jgi:hypothetical protein
MLITTPTRHSTCSRATFIILVGRIGIDRVAIGSDFDGATIPATIKDASGLPTLIAELRASGFDEDSLRKIAFDNWMRARFFDSVGGNETPYVGSGHKWRRPGRECCVGRP